MSGVEQGNWNTLLKLNDIKSTNLIIKYGWGKKEYSEIPPKNTLTHCEMFLLSSSLNDNHMLVYFKLVHPQPKYYFDIKYLFFPLKILDELQKT
jgi:hypothetical protein